MRHNWIHGVLVDLTSYAENNGLAQLREALEGPLLEAERVFELRDLPLSGTLAGNIVQSRTAGEGCQEPKRPASR